MFSVTKKKKKKKKKNNSNTYMDSSWLCVYCEKAVVSREASRLLYSAGMSTLMQTNIKAEFRVQTGKTSVLTISYFKKA